MNELAGGIYPGFRAEQAAYPCAITCDPLNALLNVTGMLERARLEREFDFEFHLAIRDIERLYPPQNTLLPADSISQATRDTVTNFRNIVDSLALKVDNEIAAALEVNTGFNLDGD